MHHHHLQPVSMANLALLDSFKRFYSKHSTKYRVASDRQGPRTLGKNDQGAIWELEELVLIGELI